MTSKVSGPNPARVAVAEEMTAAEIARKQKRIPQFAKALGSRGPMQKKADEELSNRKRQAVKDRLSRKDIAKGMKRLNKGGFVRGPNS